MNITRNNYEEFFMLYADNELPAAERREVEAFLAANQDLRHELALFQQFKLSPDAAVVFAGKETLMKQEKIGETITLANCESFFVLYADDELTSNEKAAVENFVYQHPQWQSSFELLLQVRMSPDISIVFENKESLYHKKANDKVVPFGWWKLAVAVMVLLTAGIFWLSQSKKDGKPADVVKNVQPVTITQQPSLYNKEKKKSADTNSNAQPVKEELATTRTKKENAQVKITQYVNMVAASIKKKTEQGTDNIKELQTPLVKDEGVVKNEGNKLKGSTVSSITKESGNTALINTGIAAAANKSVVNHQLAYHDTNENNHADAEQVVATNDNMEVLNTSVNTKNSLRGFFRKASRLIAKKTNPGDEEDSKHKSILIGGFEIAVR